MDMYYFAILLIFGISIAKDARFIYLLRCQFLNKFRRRTVAYLANPRVFCFQVNRYFCNNLERSLLQRRNATGYMLWLELITSEAAQIA